MPTLTSVCYCMANHNLITFCEDPPLLQLGGCSYSDYMTPMRCRIQLKELKRELFKSVEK